MTENEMVRWHHPFNIHGFEQALGDGEDREAWCAAVHGGSQIVGHDLTTEQRLLTFFQLGAKKILTT